MVVSLASVAWALPVEITDLEFTDPDLGRIQARMYVPDGPGPYPLVGFLHGWLGQAWMYDGICAALASRGYVVASTDTETGTVLDMAAFAADTVALLHHAATDPATADLVDPDEPWTAMGHSMGGGTLGRLVGLEPRIGRIVAFMPYQGEPADYDTLAAFAGTALYFDATEDTTAPPAMTDAWFSRFDGDRGLRLTLDGAGHQAVDDYPWGEETSVPHAVQHDVVIELTVAFLQAEVRGDEDGWGQVLGSAAPDVYADTLADCGSPVVWTRVDGDQLTVGIAGQAGDHAAIALGGETERPVVASVDLDPGWTEVDVAVPAGDDGLWLQVDLGDGRASRVVQVRGPSEGPGVDDGADDAEETPPARPDPVAADGGCSSAPSVGGWWLVVAAAGLRRRGSASGR